MAQFDVHVSKKPKLDEFDINRCIFCSGPFSKTAAGKIQAVSPDLTKLDSLFSACRARNDKLGEKLLMQEEKIRDGSITFRYHRNCRSTYVSPLHVQRAQQKSAACTLGNKGNDSGDVSSGGTESSLTRSKCSMSSFEWKEKCFICGERCSPKHRGTWSMVESAIDDKSKNMYTKLLEVAELREDEEMLLRLRGVPHGDLVAIEARYHRKKGCYTRYVSYRNISASVNQSKIDNAYLKAIRNLIEEYRPAIIENKEVYLLTTLKERFLQLAIENGVDNPDSYKSFNLKRQLMQECPHLSFISQPGKSDLVCSSDISVGEALSKANELAKILLEVGRDTNEFQLSSFSEPYGSIPDEAIVHSAIGILRRKLQNVARLENEYYSAKEMTLKAQKEFVDPLLYKAIRWLTDEKFFQLATSAEEDYDAKCLNIACDITTLATKVPSPKHLGLAIHMYHDYGSRKMIEDFHALGYCVSYAEVRRFLTSVSVFATATQQVTPSGAIVPAEIIPKEKGGGQPVGAGDNWDHNERTVDGRRTTHAMTSILVSPKSAEEFSLPRIPRVQERTFNAKSAPGGSLSHVLAYRKPLHRPEPKLHPPATPEEIEASSANTLTAEMTELSYNVARSGYFCTQQDGVILPWGPFHASLTSQVKLQVSNIAFNPIIMATPTDQSTIYTTLKRMKEAFGALGYTHTPVFFDMGLLTKALEIVWAHPEDLAGVIPCEGGMHLLMAVFAGIGYLYGDAGLRNLLHESGVFAAGSVEQILSGKDFDRALYALKITDEALNTRFLLQFQRWCEDNNIAIPDQIHDLLLQLQRSFSANDTSLDPSDIIKELNTVINNNLVPLITQFRMEGRAASPTFKVWDDFLYEVLLPLKLFVSASRNGDWKVHQAAKAKLLPLLFASNRTTYARYMSYQYLQLRRLPSEVADAFNEGNFVAKLTEGNFNAVWIDYTLEATENKALKGVGGIIGLTLKGNALARWFLARPITAKYSMTFHQEVCHCGKEGKIKERLHHTNTSAKRKQWDGSVKKLTEMFQGSYIDPFDLSDPPSQLVNFASGMIATLAIQEDMVSCLQKGAVAAKKFVAERLVPAEGQQTPKKSFYDPLPRIKMKTMSDMKKTVRIHTKNVSMNGELMYLRLMAVNAKKKVPLERVMSYENSPVPLSMFLEDGTMTSCVKSEFMHKLENLLPDGKITSIDSADCVIYDGHASIKLLPGPGPFDLNKICFKDMAQRFMMHTLHSANAILSNNDSQIHIIFDKYEEDSIKGQTREKRGASTSAQVHHIIPELTAPRNWNQFLLKGENKAGLAKCYTEHMIAKASKLLGEKSLFISGGQDRKVVKITNNSVVEIPDLFSNQEEADTRIILHTVTAAENGANRIVICSPDTDVLVLLLHHREAISAQEIYFLTGREGKHSNLMRYIPVHEVFKKLNREQHNIMLAVYCLTGCDTTSSFLGHGKRTAFRVMMQKATKLQALANLGSGSLTKVEQEACVQFVGFLYGAQDCVSLNQLRAEKASKNIGPKKLPPTEDSMHQHILRCVYQLSIWHQAIVAMQQLQDVLQFGYERDTITNKLQPTMMTQPNAAPELLNEIVCVCAPNRCHDQCICLKSEQPCTAACSCQAELPYQDDVDGICTNPLTMAALYHHDSDSDIE